MSTSPPNVLVIASDTIGEQMAGSGIRYWNLARLIGAQQPVTLATPSPVSLVPPPGVTLAPYGMPGSSEDERGARLSELVERHEVIVAQHLPYLYTDPLVLQSRHLVVDLYAPWILEKLEYARIDPERGEPNRRDDVTILNRLLDLGDYFLCASERQRAFWLGALATRGRLSLAHAQADPMLRSLIDVVGFGLPDDKPVATGAGVRGRFPAIGPEDPVLLWNGGMWNWLDPLSAIRSVATVAETLPNVRLAFMGTRSPGTQVAEMSVVADARQLADSLGILDRNVFFNDWVPFDERQNWLLEADATLSLHIETLEARFAFRTRMLDNLWCSVPAIVTAGDVFADIVSQEEIGIAVPAGDTAAIADAILRVLDREYARTLRENLAGAAERYTWERVSGPLLDYCRAPWKLDARREDPASAYLHHIERQYTETVAYARHLESTIAEKDRAIAALTTGRRLDLGRLLPGRHRG